MSKKDNRLMRIDEFLHTMAIYARNNDFLFTGENDDLDVVYRFLTRIGVPLDYQEYDMSYLYPQLSQLCLNYKNVSHFEYHGSYFWPFRNRDMEIFNSEDVSIKMYVPIVPDKLEMATKLILDFLDKENICVSGKVGKHIRFDNIVLRFKNKEDAMKVQKFIDKNKIIQKGLLPPSPFAISYNNIAYGGDMNRGDISYNECVADIISKYLIVKKRNNKLDTVNVYDFNNYVSQYYRNTFINGLDRDIMNESNDTILSEAFSTEQLLMALDSHNDFNDYLKHLDTMNNSEYRQLILGRVKNTKLEKEILIYEPKLKELIIQGNSMFYHDPSKIIPFIKKHYANIIPIDLVDAIIRYRMHGDEFLYASFVIDDFKEKSMALNKAILESSKKYGFKDIPFMLMNLDGIGYDSDGNRVVLDSPYYKAVTSQNGARQNIMNYFHNVGECLQTIKIILMREGYDLSNIENMEELYGIYSDMMKGRYNVR